jgi:hypothetical protein
LLGGTGSFEGAGMTFSSPVPEGFKQDFAVAGVHW